MPVLMPRAGNVTVRLTGCQHTPFPNLRLFHHGLSDPSQSDLGLKIISVCPREVAKYLGSCPTLLALTHSVL